MVTCSSFSSKHRLKRFRTNDTKRKISDMFLGAPFNMPSYAMLLLLICKETGMKPGFLSARLNDCHIYENHIDQCKEQLSRTPYDLPTVEFKKWTSIWDWEPTDMEFVNYKHHEAIKGDVAV